MIYSVTHKTKRGGSGVLTSPNIEDIEKKLKSLFKQRLTGTAYKGTEVIGKVWEDDSQRVGWNWFLDKDKTA